MLTLNENIYNQQIGRNEPKFKLWRSAGLILTYRCSAACRFCYYECSPAASPVMPVEMAVSAGLALRKLAGENAKVHLTGGEPFLEWERLEAIARAFKRENLAIEHVETNASWATDPKIIAERLRILDECGMEVLKISCDPFHQEFVPIEQVRLLAQIAAEVLGSNRVLVRWEKHLENPVLTAGQPAKDRDAAHLESLREFPCRFTGRAGLELAELAADKTIEDLAGRNCSRSFLAAKGVHIDPLGNVFSGVCSGIIIGNIGRCALDDIWRQINWRTSELVGILFDSGPVGLLGHAINTGYKNSRFYSSGCHLCTSIRHHYYKIGLYKSIIGPANCFADGAAGT